MHDTQQHPQDRLRSVQPRSAAGRVCRPSAAAAAAFLGSRLLPPTADAAGRPHVSKHCFNHVHSKHITAGGRVLHRGGGQGDGHEHRGHRCAFCTAVLCCCRLWCLFAVAARQLGASRSPVRPLLAWRLRIAACLAQLVLLPGLLLACLLLPPDGRECRGRRCAPAATLAQGLGT